MMKINPHLPPKNLSDLVRECHGCIICKKKCRFLQIYGQPGAILKQYADDPEAWQSIAFLCSLCHRCTAVCPRAYKPSEMFLEMRRQAVENRQINFHPFRSLLNYEKIGFSKAFRMYHIPRSCRSVFFPGCALPGTRPDTTWRTFTFLRQSEPDLGFILDCCIKPSHDLGRQAFFNQKFQKLISRLEKKNIRRIIVTCPSCYVVFKRYAKNIEVKTVYEILADTGIPGAGKRPFEICVHDACQTRFDSTVHHAVRTLIADRGFEVHELEDRLEKTACCGEGGAVGFVSPKMAGSWTQQRLTAFEDSKVACYCAGCTLQFAKNADTIHVLDLFFFPEKTAPEQYRAAASPVTYLNRLLLKFKTVAALGLKHTDLF